ncbi:MAG: DNA-binding response regulator [Crocinitomicaceae bacterium]|nr:DNA-binding response regulator [Crocinitomicaceae bacterium]
MNYKVLIAEDDVLIAESLKDCFEELGHTVLGIVTDKYEAKKYLDLQPDICFLDIQMHGVKEGFNIAELINEKYNIPFMFITSYADPDTVKQASLHKPSGYLVKPFDDNDVFAALEIAMANQISNHKVELKDGFSRIKLNPLDIYFVKSDDNYVEVHTKEGRKVERSTLDQFLEKLPPIFQRCHRSYLVNTELIKRVNSNEILLQDGIKVPLSKSYKEKFR